ncbi:MAG: hypothetical protein ACOYJS_07700 [Acutalibacteraceae bacterium]|jgi:hypothetical protein
MENCGNKIAAVVFTSNTGFTKRYAEIIGKEKDLPVYPYDEAVSKIPAGSAIVYLGWLRAGSIVGYKRASKRFNIKAVCGVGMAENGSQIESVKKINRLPEGLPLFILQGGFDMDKLKGLNKFAMKVMAGTVGKSLAKKENRSPEEEDMLALLQNGGDRVSIQNLTEFSAWMDKGV